jgi:hypothetical protein
LREEAGWSKCVYSYGYAACLAQLENDGLLEDGKDVKETNGKDEEREVVQVMDGVPGSMKRIAGKSIPLEVSLSPSNPFHKC